jgi:hypothetical protein
MSEQHDDPHDNRHDNPHDDQLDELIRAAAQDYNRPPAAAPRDAMWARIEAARVGSRNPVRQLPVRRAWLHWGAGLAAALLVGVAIGRWSGVGSGESGGGGSRASTVAAKESTAAPADVASRGTGGRRPRAPETGGAGSPLPSARERVPADSRLPSYQLAALQHLARTEALLTAFRVETRSGRVDPQVSAWARDLLSTTRLLLDSPAAEDAKLKKLLDDLELVLAQIAQLQPAREKGELDLIDHAVEQRNVLPRLRTLGPARPLPAGS